MFKSVLEGVLISLRSDDCPTLIRVHCKGSLKLGMMNPWAFSSYLDGCGSGQDHSVGTLPAGFEAVRMVSFYPH
jgi:hypothetical protein